MDAVTGAGIALVTFALASALQILRDRQVDQRTIAAERRADRRAQRDAKLERLRRSFLPVIQAAWGIHSATSELFYSRSGDPRNTATEIMDASTKGINEARAQLRLEENVQDVFDELAAIRQAFGIFAEGVLDKSAGVTADEMKKAYADVTQGVPRLEKLIDQHLRAVERIAD
jgi:hypothetical protein